MKYYQTLSSLRPVTIYRLKTLFFNLLISLKHPLMFFLRSFAKALDLNVENIGVEPMTSCVQGRRSSQLS